MKIQLVSDEEKAIAGYTTINYIKSGLNNLQSLSNNECEEIIATDILNSVPYNQIGNLIQGFITKLRFNGKLVLGGCDIRLFCRSIVNSTMSEEEGLQILQNYRSMPPYNVINSLLTNLGLSIQSSIISGIFYEITAVRNKN